jgi:hypothetical protein
MIGTHVTDLEGNYLGEIVDGSRGTGRWIVQDPDGVETDYDGPEMIETDAPADIEATW